MPAGKFNDLGHLGFGDLEREDAANTHAMAVDMQHHLDRVLAALGEEFFQNVNNELHRRVIVVQQQDLIERGFLGLGARAGDDAGTGSIALAVVAAVTAVAHDIQVPGARIGPRATPA